MDSVYFGVCEVYLGDNTGVRKDSRLEASTSKGIRNAVRPGSDSHVLRKSYLSVNQQSPNIWVDDGHVVDRCRSVETIFEEKSDANCRVQTPEFALERSQPSVEDVIGRLRMIRKAMEDGIEEMQCQMYQIQFCNNKLKQKPSAPKKIVETHLSLSPSLSQEKQHSGRIASAREMMYESSHSETDHSPDYCAVTQKPYSPEGRTVSVSPIRTPNFLESSDTVMSRHAASVNNELVATHQYDTIGLPVPEVSAFQISHSQFSTTDESLQDVCQLVEDTLAVDMSREPSMTRVHVNPCMGMKTDVVLNLQGQAEMPRPKKKNAFPFPKESTVDKFMGLFRKKKHRLMRDPRRATMSESPLPFSKSKSNIRWNLRSPLPRRANTITPSGGCKFTEKYPTGYPHGDSQELLQCFSTKHRGPKVEFESNTVVASSLGAQRHFVLGADSIATGVVCFDVTCLRLSGWCFVGVISKAAAMNTRGAMSACQMSYGWSNEGKCFRKGMPHATSFKEPFRTGTNFQVSSDLWLQCMTCFLAGYCECGSRLAAFSFSSSAKARMHFKATRIC